MKNLIFAIFITSLFCSVISAQTYTAFPKLKYQDQLSKKFKYFEVYDINYLEIYNGLNTTGTQSTVDLNLGNKSWKLQLFEYDLMSPNFIYSEGRDNKVVRTKKKLSLRTYTGNIIGRRGGKVSFNIADDMMMVLIEDSGASYYIEPLTGLVDGALPNEYIVYEADDVIKDKSVLCGFDAKKHIDGVADAKQNSSRNHCVVTDVALACDYSVYQARSGGSSSWAASILGLVQFNYDDDFDHPMQLSLTTVFVATTAADDPWDNINDIYAHLEVHKSWANAGGYGGASYALASAWTRKYTGGIVGLAYVSTVCTGNCYNVCSDFTGNNNTNRQLQAHEMGHNWSYQHDGGSGYIMSPSVNGSNTWSAQSIAQISSYIPSRGCLGSCGIVSPPNADFFSNKTEGCVTFTVQYTDLSGGRPTSWLWTFPGGTPSSSTTKNPLITYKTAGIYDVILRVTNSGGSDTKTATAYITAKEKPTPIWSATADQKIVQFTDNSLWAESYLWKFGDGMTSTEMEPVHEYLHDGDYTVCLKLTNVCGFKEVCKKVQVVSEVTAEFSSNSSYGCVPFTVNYINQSSNNATNYLWTFPGGNPSTSTQKNPTVVYNSTGEYDAKLRVSNSKYNATEEKLSYIYVDTICVSDFSYLGIGSTIDFTNLSRHANSYLWNFGDNSTSTTKDPSHFYANPGTYKVQLITNNVCGADTFELSLIIFGGLVSNFKTVKTNGCLPFTVSFENTSENANSYTWSFPGGTPSSSTLKNPTVVYSTSGSYDVELTATDGIDTKKLLLQKYITVDDQVITAFSQTISRFDVNFKNESQFGQSYAWDFGDNTTSTDKDPVHTYAAEGEYKVKLTTTNSCGSTTIEKIVAVYLIPKVNFSSNYKKICAGDTVQFIDQSTADVLSWSWQFDGGNINSSSLKNPVVIYDNPGVYGVKLTVANSNGTNALTILKYVEVISAIKCPEYKKGKTKGPQLKKEITENRQTNPISLFPNPASDNIFIKGLIATETSSNIKIFNMNGASVYQNNVMHRGAILPINITNLSAGIYYISIKDDVNNFQQKLIIE